MYVRDHMVSGMKGRGVTRLPSKAGMLKNCGATRLSGTAVERSVRLVVLWDGMMTDIGLDVADSMVWVQRQVLRTARMAT